MDTNEIVSTYPAPPSYYTSFTDDSTFPEPPPIPTEPYEIYGGSVIDCPLNDIKSHSQFRKDIKRFIFLLPKSYELFWL